jgi:hypothetical protein
MIELTQEQVNEVNGGFKFHFNFVLTTFTAIGAFIVTGPVGAGVVVAAAIATQGTYNLADMYHDEFGNPR